MLLLKESGLQTSWRHIKTNQKPIKLENDYTNVVTNKVSSETVKGFFLIAKNICSAFDFRQQIIWLFCLAGKYNQLRKRDLQSTRLQSALEERQTKQLNDAYY